MRSAPVPVPALRDQEPGVRSSLGGGSDDATPATGFGLDREVPDGGLLATGTGVPSALADLEGELVELVAMLERVEHGTFGICESCGEPIAVERLEAVPTARTCVVDELRG